MNNDDTRSSLVFPSINGSEFYLTHYEIIFDKLLCLDGTLYIAGTSKPWVMIFTSLDDAWKYAKIKVCENPDVYVVVQDCEKKPVFFVKDDAHIEEARRRLFGVGRKKWWRRLF